MIYYGKWTFDWCKDWFFSCVEMQRVHIKWKQITSFDKSNFVSFESFNWIKLKLKLFFCRNERKSWVILNRTRKKKIFFLFGNDSECCERSEEKWKLFLALIVYISAARKSVILTWRNSFQRKNKKDFFFFNEKCLCAVNAIKVNIYQNKSNFFLLFFYLTKWPKWIEEKETKWEKVIEFK